MSAYMFVEITVREPAVYEQYTRRIPAVISQYGGSYLVRSSKVTPVAGGWRPDRIIVIKFDDLAALRACFGSREYAELAVLRERSTDTRSIVVED
jgi:uncharacterized protein (DUF1330 family)